MKIEFCPAFNPIIRDDWERKRLKKGDMICQDDFVDMFLDNIGAFFYADESRTRRIYIEIMGERG